MNVTFCPYCRGDRIRNWLISYWCQDCLRTFTQREYREEVDSLSWERFRLEPGQAVKT